MDFTGPNGALQVLGVTLIGVTPENGRKLLLTLVFVLAAWAAGRGVAATLGAVTRGDPNPRVKFWTRQAIKILMALVSLIGVLSIWFDDPTRLATALGLVTAGLAFALQRVITAMAGYVVILRGKTFNVGDRIVMGGVRGDVIALDFMQTTIMEMGQPPPVQNDDPAMWVRARQYTGRIVTVTNAKIFDEPIYNYSRDFGYLFEEMTIPVAFEADRGRAEAILLDVARRHTRECMQLAEAEARELQRRYFMATTDFSPRVYWRITDNWLELTLRFVARDHGVRELKDAISRDVLAAFDDARIGIASATVQVVGLPPLRIRAAAEGKAG
ncbi:mechanosensitive ion channel family protein [Phenylobacterium sp.]|uniref:mechanosensitive ion channel family protein n=1 Tax=Phenylobacterium sp. TaxID=1871053 RepID=UPI0035AE8B39